MSVAEPLRVGIVGCGLIGRKRAEALHAAGDELVTCTDLVAEQAQALAGDFGGTAVAGIRELLAAEPDVVVVAVPHDQLADAACAVVSGGCHLLVEKPAGIGTRDIDRIAAARERAGGPVVKVGFNHRFHPGLARAIGETRSGVHGPVLNVRARYGHGGRLGYEQEWRARFATSGGGEIVDQGMHLLDLFHWLLGPLPLHSSLMRTQFWDAEVEDNAVLILGERDRRDAPWGLFHVSWTEWKNMFSIEIYCRDAKLVVDGLFKSYGPQKLRIYTMKPEMGPPDLEEVDYPAGDASWAAEWEHLRAVIAGEESELLGDLESARYAWSCIEAAYAGTSYEATRGEAVT